MSDTMKLYLIRHGETDWNTEGRLQGRMDIPMNDKGVAQAKLLGARLREMLSGADFLLVSSPLRRAKMCADIIADELGIEREKIIAEHFFIERSFGKSEGEIWRPAMRESERENQWEDMESLMERAKSGIENYLDRGEGQIVIVAHGAILKAVLAVLSKEKLAYGDNNSAVKQGSIVVVEYGKGLVKSISEVFV